MELAGRKITRSSLSIDGVIRQDYPDFVDAYFDHAEFEDGTPLNDDQLNDLTEQYADVVLEMATEQMYD